METPDLPRKLAWQWTALLLPPLAWAGALGVLFPLTKYACTHGTRGALWAVAAVCFLLALAGAVLARRHGEKFLARMALGLSAIFALVILMSAVPILLLESCRT